LKAARSQPGNILVAGQLVVHQISYEGQIFPARLLNGFKRGGFVKQVVQDELSG
jgi:hypothetical protein